MIAAHVAGSGAECRPLLSIYSGECVETIYTVSQLRLSAGYLTITAGLSDLTAVGCHSPSISLPVLSAATESLVAAHPGHNH